MNRILLILILMLTTIVTVNATDFNYHLYVDKTLKDDQEYRCSYVTDNKLRKFNEYGEGFNRELLKHHLKDNLSLNCSMNMDKVTLRIFKDDIRLVNKEYKNLRTLDYDFIYYELDIDVQDENNTCILNQNGILTEYVIKGSKRIKDTFFNKFTFTCVDEVDVIELEVSDKDNQELYYDSYTDIDKISYDSTKSISKDYNVIVFFNDNLSKNNKCILLLDGKTKVTKTFTHNMKRRDLIMESKVGNLIKLTCDYPMEEIKVFVDDRRWDMELVSKEYSNAKSINLNIENSMGVKIVPVVKVVEPVIVNETIDKEVITPVPTPVIKPKPVTVNKTVNKTKITQPQMPRHMPVVETLSWWQKIWGWVW